MHADQKRKKCKLLFLLLISPVFFYGQTLTGLWTGTLSHDSNTVRKDQSFEIALTEYRGKVYGYSRSEFIVNDTLYYILKRVKGTIDGDVCEVTDDDIIAYNFPGKLDKGVKVTSTFKRSKEDSSWRLDGTWKTNMVKKKYYAITGKVGLSEEKDLAHSKIFPHLEELRLADQVAFYKDQKEGIPIFAMRRVKPQLVHTEYRTRPEIDLPAAGKVEIEKIALIKNVVTIEEKIATVRKEEEERIKLTLIEEEKKQKQVEGERIKLAQLEEERKKATAAELQKQLLAKQEEEKKAAEIEEEKKKLAQLSEEKKAEQKKILAQLEEDRKRTKELEEKRKLAQLEEEKKKSTRLDEERKRVAGLDEDRKKAIKLEEEKKKKVAEEERTKLALLEEEKKKLKDLETAPADKNPPLARKEEKIVATIADPKRIMISSTKKIEELINQTKTIAGRVTDFSQEVLFKSDSLELSLYDNGEIDGDTVSVFINGEMVMAKQGLKANAIKKTIYIQPGDNNDFTLVLFADNLGKYPPNTGLLVVHDGDDIYHLRFSSDLQKSSGIVFKRKK